MGEEGRRKANQARVEKSWADLIRGKTRFAYSDQSLRESYRSQIFISRTLIDMEKKLLMKAPMKRYEKGDFAVSYDILQRCTSHQKGWMMVMISRPHVRLFASMVMMQITGSKIPSAYLHFFFWDHVSSYFRHILLIPARLKFLASFSHLEWRKGTLESSSVSRERCLERTSSCFFKGEKNLNEKERENFLHLLNSHYIVKKTGAAPLGQNTIQGCQNKLFEKYKNVRVDKMSVVFLQV